MSRKKHAFKNMVLLIGFVLAGLFIYAGAAYAEEAEVSFGSDGYEPLYNGSFPIGVYVESESVIGEYEVVLSYDTRYLEFVRGATETTKGTITISGNMARRSSKFMLNFRTLAVGDASLKVESAIIKSADGAQTYEVAGLPEAPIKVRLRTPLPFTGITINGQQLTDFAPDVLTYEMALENAEEYQAEVAGAETVATEIQELPDGGKMLYISATGRNAGMVIYKVKLNVSGISGTGENAPAEEGEAEVPREPDGSRDEDELAEDTLSEDYQNETPSDEEIRTILDRNRRMSMVKAGIVLCVLAIAIGIISLFIMSGRRRMENKRGKQKKKEKTGKDLMFDSLDSDEKK